MTIEEKARNLYTNLRKPAYTRMYLEQGFCDGARIEREFVIDKAIEWLRKHNHMIDCIAFRKAMKE